MNYFKMYFVFNLQENFTEIKPFYNQSKQTRNTKYYSDNTIISTFTS